jgi:putative colanic acid biosynthesis UDP-glucose lipid carrier transferase
LMLDADKNLIRFKIVPEYHEYIKKHTFLQSFGNIPIISIRPEPLENLLNRGIKRGFDILFALFIILFIFSWLFPILAILIKLETRGPVFFVQKRSGRDNSPFNCYKFRSMWVNPHSDKLQATKGDSRITKLGSFLRRTSLDELPQFFNVFDRQYVNGWTTPAYDHPYRSVFTIDRQVYGASFFKTRNHRLGAGKRIKRRN